MWKCLNCVYIDYSPYEVWHNGSDYSMDENLETLFCQQHKFSINNVEINELKKVIKIGDDCNEFIKKVEEENGHD